MRPPMLRFWLKPQDGDWVQVERRITLLQQRALAADPSCIAQYL